MEQVKSTVLIVDDSKTNLRILSDLLDTDKFNLLLANNGLESIKTCQENKNISLVLLDVVMPVLDGFQVCEILKQDEATKDIPVVLVTSLQSNEDKIKGFQVGAVDYITKPFQKDEILARVNTHVELFESRKKLNDKLEENRKKTKKIEELHKQIDDHVIFAQTDLKGYITYASQAFCEMSGYTKEELLNQPHNIVRHPDMPKSLFKTLWDTIKTGENWEGEVKNLAKDGSGYWVHSRISAQRDEAGEIIGYTSFRQNITQQKRAEELHKSVNNLLNNANEGFLSFGKDLLIKEGYSINSLRILNQDNLLYKDISTMLFGNDSNKKEIFELGIENIINSEDEETKEILLTLLPTENKIENIIFTISYKIINKNEYMVILSDVTEKKALEEQIEYENKIQKMIVVIATRRDEFLELKNSFSSFLDTIDESIDFQKPIEENISHVSKVLHTFKGLFAQEELVNTPFAIHELETQLLKLKQQDIVTNSKLLEFIKSAKLDKSFEKDLSFISDILGKDFLESNSNINVNIKSFKNLEYTILKLLKKESLLKDEFAQIANQFFKLNQKSLKHMLDIYPKRIKNIAERLNKEIYDLDIVGDPSILVQGKFGPFIQSLVHIFRNMIDHGIEDNDVRENLQKDYKGKIECYFYKKNENNIQLIISDDGKGIDINEIKYKALQENICSYEELETLEEQEVLKLIFHNNFSTKLNTDLLSGRGIGLYVVKKELEKIGGDIIVETKKGKGTSFIFNLPLKSDSEVSVHLEDDKQKLSQSVVDTTKEFIINNISLNIENILNISKFEIKKYYTVLKLSQASDVFVVICIDDVLFKNFLSFFVPDEEVELDETLSSSIMDEILNIIMGHAFMIFPSNYKGYELSPPLFIDSSILEKMVLNSLSYSYQIQTNCGNIYVSTIFSN